MKRERKFWILLVVVILALAITTTAYAAILFQDDAYFVRFFRPLGFDMSETTVRDNYAAPPPLATVDSVDYWDCPGAPSPGVDVWNVEGAAAIKIRKYCFPATPVIP
jgi:hypothetical protein